MDSLYEFGIEMSRWLQLNYPSLEPLMQLLSVLGNFEFYLALIPLIYWCISKRFGKEVAYLLAISNILNAVGKHLGRQPRPFWLDDSIALSEESTYGAPSGHVQSATVIYLLLAYHLQRRIGWALAILAILLMSLSRIFLGVHFWQDALLGFLIGVAVLAGYFIWRNNFQKDFGNRILGQRILIAVSIPLLIALIYAGAYFLIGELPQVAWMEMAEEAERVSIEEVFTAAGILLGLGIGFILEASRVHFLVEGPLWQRVVRYIVGIIGTVAIWRGLALVFPEDPLWVGLPLRLFRYWLAGMWVAYYAPALFVGIGLAQASPAPDVTHSISSGGIMRE